MQGLPRHDELVSTPKGGRPRGKLLGPQQWTVSGFAAFLAVGSHTITIDATDLLVASRYRWILKKGKKTYYARTSGSTKHYIHRLILGFPADDVDHKDGNGLNNRRDNLRVAGHLQNCYNRRPKPNSLAKFKGVMIRIGSKAKNPCYARITKTIDGVKRIFHLGSFPTAEQAARAYDRKAIELFGEFAWINFPSPPHGGCNGFPAVGEIHALSAHFTATHCASLANGVKGGL